MASLLKKYKERNAKPDAQASMAQTDAVLQKQSEDEATLRKEISLCLKNAKVLNKAGRKTEAKHWLIKKQKAEKRLGRVTGTRANLEAQKDALDSVIRNKDVIKAMKTGAAAIKVELGEQSVDDIAEAIEDVDEQLAQVVEVDEQLATPMAGAQVDEEAVDKELEGLDAEELDDEALQPRVQTRKAVVEDEEEVEEKVEKKEKPKTKSQAVEVVSVAAATNGKSSVAKAALTASKPATVPVLQKTVKRDELDDMLG